jgi:cell wall-associated NlpC family hydrolase
MVDGIHQCRPGSHGRFSRDAARHEWDARECPGPSTEATLSRPSTRRVLTAGAIALAVIAPTVETAERPAEAGAPPPSTTSTLPRTPAFDPAPTLGQRVARASRSAARGPSAAHRAGVRPAAVAVRHAARRAAQRETVKIAQVRREAQSRRAAAARRAAAERAAERRAAAERATERRAAERTVERRAAERPVKRVSVRRSVVKRVKQRRTVATKRLRGASSRMAAVVAYARAQIGKRYARGGEGPHSFDCSGFTKRAYAQAGIRLPHSSSGQAARARQISRAQARPGDLVVGPGHVGVYMGRGMMIDAGNPRTGVVYRRLYAGLHVERL